MKNDSNKLDPRIKSRLKDIDVFAERNPDAARTGKARFLAQANMISKSPVSNAPVLRRKGWNNLKLKEFKMGTLATLILVVGLFLGGSTATVFASQSAMPDDALYQVKLITEGLREDLTASSEGSIELDLEFANRRLDEILQLKEDGLMPPEPVFANLELHINQAIGEAALLGEGEMVATLAQIRDNLRIRERQIDQDVLDPILLRTRTILQQRIQLVESGMADPQGFYNEARTGWENTPNMGENTGPQEEKPGQGGNPDSNGNSSDQPNDGQGNQNGEGNGGTPDQGTNTGGANYNGSGGTGKGGN